MKYVQRTRNAVRSLTYESKICTRSRRAEERCGEREEEAGEGSGAGISIGIGQREIGSTMKGILSLYVLVSLIVLILIWKGPAGTFHGSIHRRVGPGRRLTLRSGVSVSQGKHESVAFDPLIAEIERRRDDREWEKRYFEQQYKEWGHHDQKGPSDGRGANDDGHGKAAPAAESQPEWEEYMNAEDYLNDEDRFNVTFRLTTLFPRLDINPTDGFLSVEELKEHHLQQGLREAMHRTDRDIEMYDANHDGHISFQEYRPPSWVLDSENNSLSGIENGWWKEEHFNASDEDGDGLLNRTEFNNFLHPADSNNPKLFQWLRKEEVREHDADRDGRLSFSEFYPGLFDLIRNYDEDILHESHVSHGLESIKEAAGKKLFIELDKNNDGSLTEDELQHVVNRLHPGEEYYAKQQADYIMMQADANKDGQLSLQEMIEHPYVFYSTIFADEDDDDDNYHDEFR